jgi:hypothetical protein
LYRVSHAGAIVSGSFAGYMAQGLEQHSIGLLKRSSEKSWRLTASWPALSGAASMVLQETAWLAAIGIGAGLAAATAVHAISRFDALRSEGDRSSYARGTGVACVCYRNVGRLGTSQPSSADPTDASAASRMRFSRNLGSDRRQCGPDGLVGSCQATPSHTA